MAKVNGLPRRAPRKRPKTPAQEYMETTRPRPPSHRRTLGDKMAASLSYLRGEAGRRARKAKAERAKADRKRRKSPEGSILGTGFQGEAVSAKGDQLGGPSFTLRSRRGH